VAKVKHPVAFILIFFVLLSFLGLKRFIPALHHFEKLLWFPFYPLYTNTKSVLCPPVTRLLLLIVILVKHSSPERPCFSLLTAISELYLLPFSYLHETKLMLTTFKIVDFMILCMQADLAGE